MRVKAHHSLLIERRVYNNLGGDFMYKDYYTVFGRMRDLKLMDSDVVTIMRMLEVHLDAIASGYLGIDFIKRSDACRKCSEYIVLLERATYLVEGISAYYLQKSVDQAWVMDLYKNDKMEQLNIGTFQKHCTECLEKYDFGELLSDLTYFKEHDSRMWNELLYDLKRDYKLNFWSDAKHSKHRELSSCNHFLVHSVPDLAYEYTKYLFGVPVSCSVFCVEDPWYYLCDKRNILLVYDTDTCDVLGGSAYDCSTSFSEWKPSDRVDAFFIACEIAMPTNWSYKQVLPIRPNVPKGVYIERVAKHDPNDVGEIIVKGEPCAIIINDVNKSGFSIENTLLFAQYFQLPLYEMKNGRLTTVNIKEYVK